MHRTPIFSPGWVFAMTPALLTPYPPPPHHPIAASIAATGDEGKRPRIRSPLLNFGTVPVGEETRSAQEETREAVCTRENRQREGARAPGWPVGCEPELIHILLHCFLRYNCGLLVVIHGANSISCPARGTEIEVAPMAKESCALSFSLSLFLPSCIRQHKRQKKRIGIAFPRCQTEQDGEITRRITRNKLRGKSTNLPLRNTRQKNWNYIIKTRARERKLYFIQ